MSFKRLLCAVLTVFTVATLSGCRIFAIDTDKLLAAPQLTGELKPIGMALSGSIKGAFFLRYPSGGDCKSAVILHDTDGDGVQEAFAFYSKNDEEMHLAVIKRDGEKWSVSDDISLTAGGVERIDFCDLSGDGSKEILVGWEIHGSADKQLAVYSLSAEKLNQIMIKKYTAYVCCDLDSDGRNELLLQLLSATDTANKAYLYKYDNGELNEAASCNMDRNVKSVSAQTVAPLSSGQAAVYIDELKNAGAVTEVLFVSKGQLVNPLLDSTAGENLLTERAATLMCSDVNRDGLLEIPVAEEIPAVSGSPEKCYYTFWCTFNGEALLSQQTDIINQVDGFYFSVPEKWIGRIAVYRDAEKGIREFYSLAEDGQPKVLLAQLRLIDAKDWDKSDYSRGELTELLRNGDSVLAGAAGTDTDLLRLTVEELRKHTFIYE